MPSRPTTILASVVMILASTTAAHALTHNIGLTTGLIVPSFRGDANSNWLGWDSFDDNGANDQIINDSTPDLGWAAGSFVTNNGEDHISSTSDFYSGFTAVDETVTVATNPGGSGGYTTVIAQASALSDPRFGPPGPFYLDIAFGDINGVAPTQYVHAVDATGNGQMWAKYEIPGSPSNVAFTLSVPLIPGGTHISMDKFIVDTYWSADGFAPDFAIAAPEPTSACLALLGMFGLHVARRR